MLALKQLEEMINKLKRDNYQADILLNLASMFERLAEKNDLGESVFQLNELLAQFHNYAGRYPFIDDRDFGALVLEVTATNLKDLSLRKRIINEAIYRVSWCAQGAISGGEGTCRAQHLSRLKEYLKKLNEEID